jgi:hypothetical protein
MSGAQMAKLSPVSQACAAALAVVATGTSAWISVVAGWDRGGRLDERLAWIFVGLVLLLSAHLIPALSRGSSLSLRVPAVLLWVVSMVATGYGHATFFIVAQQHAGEVRASLVPSDAATITPAAATGRSLDAIAVERSRVVHDLAVANAATCLEKCGSVSIKRASLAARLSALDLEVGEAKRREAASDSAAAERARQMARRDSAMSDPVTLKVAQLFKASAGTVDLVVALTFGWLLECVACLGWLLALPCRDATASIGSNAAAVQSHAVTERSNTTVTAAVDAAAGGIEIVAGSSVPVAAGSGSDTAPGVDQDTVTIPRVPNADLARLAAGIAEGRTRATVAEIRKFFRCSQARAMALRKQFDEAVPGSLRAG